MSYWLPRAVMLLIVWGMTCGLIRHFWPETDPIVFGIAGAFWAVGGVAYFAYLRKLRRDIDKLERDWRHSAPRGAIKTPANIVPRDLVTSSDG